MKRKLLLAGLSFLLLTIAEAQNYDYPSPVTTSMGLSGASDTTVWSLFSNPSGLSSVQNISGGVGYHNAFGIKALSARSAFIAIPFQFLNTGFSYIQYGDELYNMQTISFSAARNLSPDLCMGIRFKYIFRNIQGAETRNVFIADAGVSYKPRAGVRFAFFAQNPARSVISDGYNEQILPSSLAFACMVRLSDSFFFTADLAHRQDLSRQFYAMGLSARIHKSSVIRGVISAKPVRLAIGSTLSWNGFEINYSASYQDVLGLSSTAGIAYVFDFKRGGND